MKETIRKIHMTKNPRLAALLDNDNWKDDLLYGGEIYSEAAHALTHLRV